MHNKMTVAFTSKATAMTGSLKITKIYIQLKAFLFFLDGLHFPPHFDLGKKFKRPLSGASPVTVA